MTVSLTPAAGSSTSAGAGTGTSDHAALTNRDAANQHPVAAIIGLQQQLDEKASAASIDGNVTILRNRRQLAAQWTASNPILGDGVLGVETDTRRVKIGDGITPWASLPYFTAPSAPDVVPASITISQGNSQSVTVNTAVPIAPRVVVRNAAGTVLPNVAVLSAVSAGNGTVTGGSVLTDGSGLASVGSWTVGGTPGANSLLCTVVGYPSLSVTFSATGVAAGATPTQVFVVQGNGQAGYAGVTLTVAPKVQVFDASFNALAGVPMTFAIQSGGGSLTGATGVTDSFGELAVGSWTLGATLGGQVLRAYVTGSPSVYFDIVATAIELPVVTTIQAALGSGQSAPAGTAAPVQLVARVLDQNGVAMFGKVGVWSVQSGGGSIGALNNITDPDGIVAAIAVLGSAGTNTYRFTIGSVYAQFTLTATSVAGDTLSIISGNNQAGVIGITLEQPLRVRLMNGINPVVGATIGVALTQGAGTLSAPSCTTDASGYAEVTFTCSMTGGPSITRPKVRFSRGSSTVDFDVDDVMDPAYDVAPAGTADIQRFLAQATIGPTPTGAADFAANYATFGAWITAQKAIPATEFQSDGDDYGTGGTIKNASWDWIRVQVVGPDALRARLTHVIQQIIVAGEPPVTVRTIDFKRWNYQLRYYCLANFRDLLNRSILATLPGLFLNNQANKGNQFPPNQNFARELLQLYSLGQQKLKMDGTLDLDTNGNPQEAYTQADVVALSKILAGYDIYPPFSFDDDTGTGWFGGDMKPRPSYASGEGVTFLGQVFPAFTPTETEMLARKDAALQLIMDQPTLAPYQAKQMIRKLVTDNPTPAYVKRVSAIFRNNGSGVRGDMTAVVRAILLDPEARGNSKAVDYGRAQDSMLSLMAMLRYSEQQQYSPWSVRDQTYMRSFTYGWGYQLMLGMGQAPFKPSSVFNDYPFDYQIEKGFYSPASALWRTNVVVGNFAYTLGLTDKMREQPVNDFATLLGTYWGSAGLTNTQMVDRMYADLVPGQTPSVTTRNELIAFAGDLDAVSGMTAARKAVILINMIRQLPDFQEVR